MMELLYYFLKVSACTALFFAFYLLVLRRLTFFKINRFYLLITLTIGFIIPTLHFTFEREVEQTEVINAPEIGQVAEITNQSLQMPIQTEIIAPLKEEFDYYSLLPYLYLGVAICLLLVAIWRLFELVKHTRNSVEKINGLRIVSKATGFTNCSFFNYVFIDEGSLTANELNILLRHEEVHAKQFHSIDKIILMVIKAVLWFNPVVYLYDKALEQAHEYEADEATSQNFGAPEYANLLLRLAVSKSEMPLVHNFVKSPIKGRIKMLFNSKSKNMKKWMYLLALPIGLGLLWSFTVDVVDVLPSPKNEEKEFTLVLDAGHGGSQTGTQVNGYTEKALTLAMAKKIKALAEAKGINVVTTRNSDENISIKDRAKADGTMILSLHINSAPKATANGIEMVTSGSYTNDNDLKLLKSNDITYYLYKELKNLTGIKVNDKPRNTSILLLNQSPIPGIVLEMGYLTNKSDFDFITNEKKQDELAKLIVAGILTYKEKLPASEDMQAKLKKMSDEFNVKYTAWKKSEKYAWLVSESKNFKAQTLLGKIQSLNYFKMGRIPTLDGFILSANNKLYRIYIDKEQLKSMSFKVGDEVSLHAPKAEVWFDSEYLAITPKKVAILKSVGVAPVTSKPKLISASSLNVDTKNNITYIKNGVFMLAVGKLEGVEMMWDLKNEVISAKKATFTSKNGNKIVSESIIYDAKKGTYEAIAASGIKGTKSSFIVNKSPEVENPTISVGDTKFKTLNIQFGDVKHFAQDSTRIDKINQVIYLYGNAKLKYKDIEISSDEIEYHIKNNTVYAKDPILKEGNQYIRRTGFVTCNLEAPHFFRY